MARHAVVAEGRDGVSLGRSSPAGCDFIWFYFASYMNRARLRQQRAGRRLSPPCAATSTGRSPRGIPDQDRAGHPLAGLRPGVAVTAGLWVLIVFRLTAAPAWTYVFMGATMLGALVTVVGGKNRAISEEYEPHQRELEALRRKLADPQR